MLMRWRDQLGGQGPVDCPMGSLSALILSLPPGAERERLAEIRWLRIMDEAWKGPPRNLGIVVHFLGLEG